MSFLGRFWAILPLAWAPDKNGLQRIVYGSMNLKNSFGGLLRPPNNCPPNDEAQILFFPRLLNIYPSNRYIWDTLPYFAIGEGDSREWKSGWERSTWPSECRRASFIFAAFCQTYLFSWMIQAYLKWVTILERGRLERSIWWVEWCEGQDSTSPLFFRQFINSFQDLINFKFKFKEISSEFVNPSFSFLSFVYL